MSNQEYEFGEHGYLTDTIQQHQRKLAELKHLNILAIIKAIRESDPLVEHIYTQGGCYQFHLILKSIHPEAKPMRVDKDNGVHIVTQIDEHLYDIKGKVLKPVREMTDDQIREAEQYQFSKMYYATVGECEHCAEPIRVEISTTE